MKEKSNLIGAMARVCAVAVGVSMVAGAVHAASDNTRTIQADRYNPALGITPDGCQVWMIDDGWEGYAWNRTDRDGKPVCVKVETCFRADTDALFATDSSKLRPSARKKLMSLFRQKGVYSYAINGHTDSRASMEYNLALSKRRAAAVAKVAKQAGAKVTAVRAYGEAYPIASNKTKEGRRANRRVEISCYRDIGRF